MEEEQDVKEDFAQTNYESNHHHKRCKWENDEQQRVAVEDYDFIRRNGCGYHNREA